MLDYLENFTDHFDLRRRIKFRTQVTSARPRDDGWEVEAGGKRASFSALVVATGFNSAPLYPDLRGEFGGLQMHTHDYRTPAPFAGRDTVIVGLGCSAAELACEISNVARSVTIASRSGSWVVPRRLGPIPIDWFDTRFASHITFSVRRRAMVPLFRLAAGNLQGTGLLSPNHRLGDKPITVSDDLLQMLRRGRIKAVGAVEELRGDRVLVEGGSEVRTDALLFGTGYRTVFSFLPPETDPPSNNRASLYRGVLSLTGPDLYYVGIAMGHGALIPMMEAQANWTADVLAGRLILPNSAEMQRSVELDSVVRRRQFDPRFGFIWDRLAYCRSLESESRKAARHPGRTSSRAGAATIA